MLAAGEEVGGPFWGPCNETILGTPVFLDTPIQFDLLAATKPSTAYPRSPQSRKLQPRKA